MAEVRQISEADLVEGACLATGIEMIHLACDAHNGLYGGPSMKKKDDSKAQLDRLLSESWMAQLDNELDPADTMNSLNRMALLTSELAGRLGSIIEELEQNSKK